MSAPVVVKDLKDLYLEYHKRDDIPTGNVSFTHPFLLTSVRAVPFLNDNFGAAMNQDVSFGAIASILHDGGTTSSNLTGTADTNTLNKLEDSSAPFGDGETVVRVGMTVENTNDNTYARVSAVDSTSVLSLTTIASKGTVDSDIFPDGTDPYIIDAVWTGAATIGIWDFSGGGVITQAGANNGDRCDILAAPDDQKLMSDFTALTGTIDLNTYSAVTNDISICMTLDGALVGNIVFINDFINTGNFDAQQFSIPLPALGLTDQLANGVRVVVERSGGAKPAFTLDNIRLEISGSPIVFKIEAPEGTKYHITEVRVTVKDTTPAVLVNGTLLGLNVDKILGLSQLTNGIGFTRVEDNEIIFSVTLRTLSDFIQGGSDIKNAMSLDGVTQISIVISFPDAIILDSATNDFFAFVINDNLSGLSALTALTIGSIEL